MNKCWIRLAVTWQAGGDVDVGVEAFVGQQVRDAVPGLHAEGVVGAGQQVEHGDRTAAQAALLRHEAHVSAARLAVFPRAGDAALTRHAVTHVHTTTRVCRSRPLQDQSGLFQCVEQVSWRRGRS